MQYLRRRGFALINTVIIISILMTLSSFMFNIMKNNMDISSKNYIDDDFFSVDKSEEKIIYEFTGILNDKNKVNTTDVFYSSFEEKNGDNKLKYFKDTNKLILKIYGKYSSLKIRELRYSIKNNRIILIPTFNFIDTNTEFDKF